MTTRLRLWRVQAGLSQTEAAAALHLSRATYSPIELGRMVPTDDVAAALREAFGEPAGALLESLKPRQSIPVLRHADSKKAAR